MEGLPGWVISPMSGPPPRQHKHEIRYTASTHPFSLTRRRWKDDSDGQMIFGDLVGLNLPDICLTSEEKPRKNLAQETRPDRESNPGHLRERRACYRLFHSSEHMQSSTIFWFDIYYTVCVCRGLYGTLISQLQKFLCTPLIRGKFHY